MSRRKTASAAHIWRSAIRLPFLRGQASRLLAASAPAISPPADAARLGGTGVDEHAVMQLICEGCELAALTSAIGLKMPIEVLLAGTEGCLTLHEPFYKANRFTITPVEGEPRSYSVPYEGNGYQFQALEVMRCLNAGLLESPTMPLDETLQIMQTMDAIREQWGLKYPNE